MTACACGCGAEVAPPNRWVKGHNKRNPATGQPCSVEGCERPIEQQGLCHSHAAYLHRTGVRPTEPIADRDPVVRFWSKVNKTDGCWLWTGATDGDGRYGAFQYEGRVQRAHRVAYMLTVGPIPDGMTLDHLCRTTLCVRPDHLDPVTHRTNVLRGEAPSAANALKTHCPKGHAYDEANTYIQATGGRMCKTCAREKGAAAQRRYRERKRSA